MNTQRITSFVVAICLLAAMYSAFDWSINRVYVPVGQSLQLRYKGPLIFGSRKTANIGQLGRGRGNGRAGVDARAGTAFLLPDLVGKDLGRRLCH
ncbi:MAG: hypothetical protein ACLQNE_27925 [Thermoguttaceae bacterium]